MTNKFWQFCQKSWVQVTFLVLVALILRLYKLDTPLADWHSFRQSDTASVSYEYYQAVQQGGSIDLLRPQYQDISNIQSGQENPEGWRMVEFPLVNGFVAWLMVFFQTENVVLVYRLVNITLSLFAIGGLYFFLFKVSKRRLIAFLGSFLLATLPYAIFYSRAILPEVALVTGQIFTLLFFWNYLSAKKTAPKIIYFLATFLVFALSLLIKPNAVFVAPALLYLAFMRYHLQMFKQWPLYLLVLISAAPLLLWRQWITNFPTGIPASSWLIQGAGNSQGQSFWEWYTGGCPYCSYTKAFTPSWFRWLFVERLIKMICGFWGTITLFIGLLKRTNEKKGLTGFDFFCWAWALGGILFLIIFASGNVQHDYYQVFLLPLVVTLMAKGLTWLIDHVKWTVFRQASGIIGLIAGAFVVIGLNYLLINFAGATLSTQTLSTQLIILVLALLFLTVLALFAPLISRRFSARLQPLVLSILMAFFLLGAISNYYLLWQRDSGFYQINHPEIILAGEAVRQLTPPDAKIIAPYQSDTTFLFQARRRGWPIGYDIEDKIALGAQYYVTTTKDDEANELRLLYPVLAETDDYLILDLTQPSPSLGLESPSQP